VYFVNFCGGVTGAGDSFAARKGSSPTRLNIGAINQRVELSDRQLSMTFPNGDACNSTAPGAPSTWSLVVVFVCDPSASRGGVSSQLKLIRDNSEQCTVSMEYRTPAACYTGIVADCKVKQSS
jgi:hypothetical protein